jgi:hypothetical protein
MAEEREPLEDYFARQIAEKEGVDPSEVTLEYIRKQREERSYPSQIFLDGGLRCMSRREIQELHDRVERGLEPFYSLA